MSDRARVLFVDDEKRVLNSMRGMFRRQFELYLTTEGATAVQIASENPIDVIVADQRMPGMTGIEVLQKVKELSPNTVRILLTGYADPSAVEDSINVGEVFRFLGKPCPPKLLRETLDLAITATRDGKRAGAPAPVAADPPRRERAALHSQAGAPNPANRFDEALARWQSTTRAALAADAHKAAHDSDAGTRITARAREVGAVVYTVDAGFAETAIRALSPDRSTTLATSLIRVMQAIEQDTTGVLITDIAINSTRLQRVLGALKQHRPELMTIAVSDSRDTTDMVRLINYARVFRYCVKPLSSRQLRADVDEAAVKHLELRNDPRSVKRHAVVEFPTEAETSPALESILSHIRRNRSPVVKAEDGH